MNLTLIDSHTDQVQFELSFTQAWIQKYTHTQMLTHTCLQFLSAVLRVALLSVLPKNGIVDLPLLDEVGLFQTLLAYAMCPV